MLMTMMFKRRSKVKKKARSCIKMQIRRNVTSDKMSLKHQSIKKSLIAIRTGPKKTKVKLRALKLISNSCPSFSSKSSYPSQILWSTSM